MAGAPEYITTKLGQGQDRVFCRVPDFEGKPRWNYYSEANVVEVGDLPLNYSVLYYDDDWVIVNNYLFDPTKTVSENSIAITKRSVAGIVDTTPSSYFTNYCTSLSSVEVLNSGIPEVNGLYLKYDDPQRLVMGKRYSVFKKSPNSLYTIELDILRENQRRVYIWTIYGSKTPYDGAPAYEHRRFTNIGEDLLDIRCPPVRTWVSIPGANAGDAPTLSLRLRAP